ncbi:response regulator [Paenibacillus sp. 1011MAR3C5]|uniref:response regulator n=1 Tax=Paenibacillus sp. 1011MAR3C5 TaxID=1675787 RepID=UPI000E6CF683|nr:response regulator [Paenibacillus sp. 1011MAR3C5]RJE87695.1 response regulator [Paenibacillus sp. 1011MAR3C5]
MKLLIVDDEVIIRTGLSTVIPWPEYGYELLQPAASAEEAIARLESERPDIVLTDIQMTGLNGFDLAREVRRILPSTEVIILTGYDQFEYARRAITEGVSDYLLKTSRPDEIKSAVGAARERIVLRGESGNRNELREKLIETLIQGGEVDYATMRQSMRLLPRLRMDTASRYVVCCIGATGWGTENGYGKLLLFAAHNVIDELVEGEAALREDHILLILPLMKGEEGSLAKLEDMLMRIERKLKCKLYAAVGEEVCSLDELKRSIDSAQHTFLYHGLLPDVRMIHTRDVCRRKGGRRACSPGEKEDLYALLQEGDAPALQLWLEGMVDALESDEETTPESYHAYLNSVLLEAEESVYRLVKEAGAEPAAAIKALPIPLKLAAENGREEMMNRVLELLKDYLTASGHHSMPPMNRAITYIQEHLEEDLSLALVAKRVQLTPHHFSEVFRRETGHTYAEFVAKARVEKAMVLLKETDASSSEIASRVGYGDVEFFSGLFEKHTGFTPWEYRRRR